jgi:hypothetical protein
MTQTTLPTKAQRDSHQNDNQLTSRRILKPTKGYPMHCKDHKKVLWRVNWRFQMLWWSGCGVGQNRWVWHRPVAHRSSFNHMSKEDRHEWRMIWSSQPGSN